MWTCTKCSYAYNPLWVELCDICASRRTPPSLTQPSLTTVTKDELAILHHHNRDHNDEKSSITINKDGAVKYSTTKSSGSLLNESLNLEVPIATFEQDLEDDIIFASDTVDALHEWTCKKCTLVNSVKTKVCIVCGGSKLNSTVEEATLRKGEFWSCIQCTLKNALSANICVACKSVKQSGQLCFF